VAMRAAAYVDRARAVTGAVAGAVADTTPFPRLLDDAAVQREIARAIVANRWSATATTRFLVVTAGTPVSSLPYCGYHSAFDLGGNLAKPAIYAVVPAQSEQGCATFAARVGAERNELVTDPFALGRP
ncbi:MAG: hypothetical protein IAI50_05540, partial [Candidatus Eremiobacteraeota bacterium]|nr:hypothetical protein [Candidatus Eremiobacteraeota bacterium]